jgi:hypothetical protein
MKYCFQLNNYTHGDDAKIKGYMINTVTLTESVLKQTLISSSRIEKPITSTTTTITTTAAASADTTITTASTTNSSSNSNL